MTHKLLLTGAAAVLIAASGACWAQGRGGSMGHGGSGGFGASAAGGLGGGLGGDIGAANGRFDTRISPSAHATEERGSADVLPYTHASPRGVERGSLSSSYAANHTVGVSGKSRHKLNTHSRLARSAAIDRTGYSHRSLRSHASRRGILASSGQIDRTTRGSSDVLPDTRASARGVARGSMSSTRAGGPR